MSEKLQKVLARAGLGSRRMMEQWIQAGRVTVNGKKAQLGERVTEEDILRVDGRLLSQEQTTPDRTRVLAYHKPAGEICSRRDPEGRPSLFEHLPRLHKGRWITIGRLDLNTTGLLLLTNNGELANRLMHPSNKIEREYAVRILGEVDDEILKRLREGVELEDGPARFEHLRDAGGSGANHWYHVVIREGRNREVRRLWESQGMTVSRLTRVRYGPVTLRRGLPQGRWDELDNDQIAELLNLVGLQQPVAKPHPGKRRPPRTPRTARRR
ncbi:MAG TPA: 23S rRNA pseudouridine(2605) synthase RluB [Gammaproteobacteria bacterium]|nr:23S rRNA pseudouridine(2605) synthase RluB [Gammaproteobacteria bacterium]